MKVHQIKRELKISSASK